MASSPNLSAYKLLEPAVLGSGGAENVASFTTYFASIIKTTLVLGAFLAVLMIVIGGVEKIISKTPAGKTDGNEKIYGALVGLFLLIISATILTTINPDLLNLEFFKPGAAAPVVQDNPGNPVVVTGPGGPVLAGDAREATADNLTGNGRATTFGCFADTHPGCTETRGQDNGYGSPHLDPAHSSTGILTNDPNIIGVAIPQEVLRRTLNLPAVDNNNWADWAPARNAGVRVTNSDGTTMVVPIVDLGPGKEPRNRGVVIDETHALHQRMGGDGARTYEIIPDYYLTNPRP